MHAYIHSEAARPRLLESPRTEGSSSSLRPHTLGAYIYMYTPIYTHTEAARTRLLKKKESPRTGLRLWNLRTEMRADLRIGMGCPRVRRMVVLVYEALSCWCMWP